MLRSLCGLACLAFIFLLAPRTFGRPASTPPELAVPNLAPDRVGDLDAPRAPARKALQDTLWIANWTFDTGKPCDAEGWTQADLYVLNDGIVRWHMETGFATVAGMQGQSAAVGYHANACCAEPDGYDNDWYQAIRIPYHGAATLSLDFILDSEAGYDFLQVETDSACASFARVDLEAAPHDSASRYREVVANASGLVTNGDWNGVALPAYGGAMNCVYIAFFADGGGSPCDGIYPSAIGEAAVIDNILITDASGTRTETFEDGRLDLGTFLNIVDTTSFGAWARLYPHVSDNDLCTENPTCAWLWTDYTTPTLYNDPGMAFGPSGYVIKNWLDDAIVSPWVSLASTPDASGTVLTFRRFAGNFFGTSRIVQNWSVRGRHPVAGQTCVERWANDSAWNALGDFRWATLHEALTPHIGPSATDVQVRFRTSDWQWISGAAPPQPWIPGPGPYLDDVRIGRVLPHGPAISEGSDARSQAQDCFPTEIDPNVTPAGEHYRPTTDRFGTCAFSSGIDLAAHNVIPNLITGDSITVNVSAVRVGGDVVTSVTWHGAIVRGPHGNKAPAPYAVGPNGFFSLAADSVRSTSGSPLAGRFCVDLDDTYFRGGDVLLYFWSATDNGGGFTSDPEGLTALPVSVAQAEAQTGGLLEVSYLPTVTWAASYLGRIAADAHGDLAPTPAELAASSQANCILYVNLVNTRRRSGDANRTSFLYGLDRLGYGDHYDVYDHTGFGNTNNHLGGRATILQAQSYNLIVYDTGNQDPLDILMPAGTNMEHKIDQQGWFRSWLAQAALGEARFATLWLIGSNLIEGSPTLPLYTENLNVSLAAPDQGRGLNPIVDGQAGFTFDTGTGGTSADFAANLYGLDGGCPSIRNYDGLDNHGTAVVTHLYRNSATAEPGPAAIVMNSSPAENWNTILQSHPFFDIRPVGTPQGKFPALDLLQTILGATLPPGCIRFPTPTGSPEGNDIPRATVLHANVPNPFNPTTEIRFDLAQSGKVSLRVFDVAGNLVRTLVDGAMVAGRDHRVLWNGLDTRDRPVASGVYFYRLEAPGASRTRKLVVMR